MVNHISACCRIFYTRTAASTRASTASSFFFQQDGTPPHFALNVRAYLDQTFPDRWIGRAGPFAWPPRSPDLNPLDFYLWGHVKTAVYRTKPRSTAELKQRITDALAAIPV